MTHAIYNEIEPYAAEWLGNLVDAGHIAHGVVDTRSISDLRPDDVAGDGQRHFFAGIGVWSRALRLAGWPDDVPVWTGSCPCQPFSAAGKRGGFDDERHLWPTWFNLIRECRPTVVFGEQVASPDGLAWLDAVCADLEGAGYTVGAQDLCAAGVGAPHIRQRLYFVAVADGERLEESPGPGDARSRFVADADDPGPQGRGQRRNGRDQRATRSGRVVGAGPTGGFWQPCDWIPCRDGKARPVEPGTFPLVDGTTARVGRLRAYGNAIVAPLAAEVISATMEYLCW